jgi:hypothetical protein
MVKKNSKMYALTWFCCLYGQRRFLYDFGLKLIVIFVLSILVHLNFTILSLPPTDNQGKHKWVNVRVGIGYFIYSASSVSISTSPSQVSFRLSIVGFCIFHLSISKHRNYLENVDVPKFIFRYSFFRYFYNLTVGQAS